MTAKTRRYELPMYVYRRGDLGWLEFRARLPAELREDFAQTFWTKSLSTKEWNVKARLTYATVRAEYENAIAEARRKRAGIPAASDIFTGWVIEGCKRWRVELVPL